MDSESQIIELRLLAEREIARLRSMPQPVVRVCGPLTTGGFGSFERNATRIRDAETLLEQRGLHVFRFDDAEVEIQGKGYDHMLIMEAFHGPVLASGLIQTAYFLPGWERSKGATWERNYISAHTHIAIEEFHESWFTQQ